MFRNLFANVRAKSPLVHNITNYVTVNDCANIVLACGASPIKALPICAPKRHCASCGK